MTAEDDREAIRAILVAIETAWRKGPTDAIVDAICPYLDDEVVFRGPEFVEAARGARACAESYATFVLEADVHAYDATERAIDINGEIGIAMYQWSMKYEHAGTRYLENGGDIYGFVRRAGRWRIVWRALVPQRTMTG